MKRKKEIPISDTEALSADGAYRTLISDLTPENSVRYRLTFPVMPQDKKAESFFGAMADGLRQYCNTFQGQAVSFRLDCGKSGSDNGYLSFGFSFFAYQEQIPFRYFRFGILWDSRRHRLVSIRPLEKSRVGEFILRNGRLFRVSNRFENPSLLPIRSSVLLASSTEEPTDGDLWHRFLTKRSLSWKNAVASWKNRRRTLEKKSKA